MPVQLDPLDPSRGRRGLVEPMRIDLGTIYKRGKRGYFGECNYLSALSLLFWPHDTDTPLCRSGSEAGRGPGKEVDIRYPEFVVV